MQIPAIAVATDTAILKRGWLQVLRFPELVQFRRKIALIHHQKILGPPFQHTIQPVDQIVVLKSRLPGGGAYDQE